MGTGILRISHHLMGQWCPLMQPPTSGQVTFGRTENLLAQFAVLGELLQLPETFVMRGLFYDCVAHYWYLHVEHADLPSQEQCFLLPELTALYSTDVFTGKLSLTKITWDQVVLFAATPLAEPSW